MDTRLTLPRPTAITHVVPSAVFRVAKTRVRRAGYSHTVAVKGTEGAWPPWECTERVSARVVTSTVITVTVSYPFLSSTRPVTHERMERGRGRTWGVCEGKERENDGIHRLKFLPRSRTLDKGTECGFYS